MKPDEDKTKIKDEDLDTMVDFIHLALQLKVPGMPREQAENMIINLGMLLQLRKLKQDK